MSSTGSEGEAENIQLSDDTLRNEFVEPEYVDYSGDFITDKQWSDREEMIKWARGVGWKRNMTIVIMKSWKASKSRGAKVLLSCEKSGERRSGKRFLGIGEVQTWISRKGNTKKTNYPFVLEGCEISPSAWRLSIRCGRHNHDLPPGLEGHAFEGRLKPKEYEEVRKLSKAGARPTAVLKAIRDEPEASEPNYTSRQQIYNAKAKQRREARGGMSEIQYLFSMMVKKKYSFNYRLSPEGNWIQDLVFAHPESLKFWEIFPYTMIIDATYHTNKYHMPLCEIVGMTCSGKTFNIAFAFMRNELYDNYAWVFQQLAGWIKGRPTVIVTDRDKSILKAIPDVFPDAHHMLCLLHIERNIESRALDVTNSKSETYKFQRASMKLINSQTYAEFIQQLECMKGVYGNKWHLMDYLETTLVNPHASKILRCWTDHYLHFDNKTTNRVESAHSVLKQNVNSATGGFDTVFEHIDRMLEDQIRNVKTSLEYSRNNVPMEFKNEGMFVVIEQRVSLKCLEELFAILTEARSGNYTEECNDWWRRTTLGLPCVHEVVRIIQENRVFYPEDVHPFWRQVNWDRPLLEDVPIGISMHDVVLRKFYKDYEDGSVAEHNIRQVSNLLMAINEPQSVPFKDPPPLEAKKGRPKKPPGGRERSAFEHGSRIRSTLEILRQNGSRIRSCFIRLLRATSGLY